MPYSEGKKMASTEVIREAALYLEYFLKGVSGWKDIIIIIIIEML